MTHLAERLAAMLPVADAHVFFGNSGSDANDTHWKLLRYYYNAIGQPAKRKIIVRKAAYHGVTVAAASFTGLQGNHTHFDLPFEALGILRTEAAHFYRHGLPGESETEYATRLAANLEELILREDPRTIAAFMAEPVSGAGGVLVAPATYWEKVQAVLRKYDILLIDDEVITGFGRTGNDFGATTFGIRPQMLTLAKAVTSGYLPLSAAVISGAMYEPFATASEKVGTFSHGYTYSGHPVSCAVALKTLEIYARERIFEHAARVYLDPETMAGSITIATTPSISVYWLIPVLGEFSARYPEVELRMVNIEPRLHVMPPDVDIAICCASRSSTIATASGPVGSKLRA